MISTNELLSSGALAAKLPAGEQVRLDCGTCAALYGERDERLLLTGMSARNIRVPDEGVSYAISWSAMSIRFGMANLGMYTLADYPNKRFPFGLNGAFAVEFAHTKGFKRLIAYSKPDQLELKDVYALCEPQLRHATIDAIDELNAGRDWEYNKIRTNMTELTRIIWTNWFSILFDNGLLLLNRDFVINGVAIPRT